VKWGHLIAALIALAVAVAALVLTSCTTVVIIDRPECSTERSVEIKRQPDVAPSTTIKSHRVCGKKPDALGSSSLGDSFARRA
jgi:hypothetical protein